MNKEIAKMNTITQEKRAGLLLFFCLFPFIFFACTEKKAEEASFIYPGFTLDPTPYEGSLNPKECFSGAKTLRLCHAIAEHDLDKMQKAIDAGADVNAKGKDNISLVLWAMLAGKNELELLLKNGADPNVIAEKEYLGDFRVQDAGESLLYTAINLEAVYRDGSYDGLPKLLLKYNADPNAGKYPALWAALSNLMRNPEIVPLLLEAGADVNLIKDGSFPLSRAMSLCPDYIIYLLEHGAIYDVATPQGSYLQAVLYRTSADSEGYMSMINNPEKERRIVKEVIAWLKEHGVSFDHPVEIISEETLSRELEDERRKYENKDSLGKRRAYHDQIESFLGKIETAISEKDDEAVRSNISQFLSLLKNNKWYVKYPFAQEFCKTLTRRWALMLFNSHRESLACEILDTALPVMKEIAPSIDPENFQRDPDALTQDSYIQITADPKTFAADIYLQKAKLQLLKNVWEKNEEGVVKTVDDILQTAKTDKYVALCQTNLVFCISEQYEEQAIRLIDAGILARQLQLRYDSDNIDSFIFSNRRLESIKETLEAQIQAKAANGAEK